MGNLELSSQILANPEHWLHLWIVYPHPDLLRAADPRAGHVTTMMASHTAGLFMSARVSIRARPLNGRAPNPAPVRRSAVVIEAAKGRNAKLAGRNKKAQSIEDNKWREGMEAAAAERADKKKAEPKQSGLKYSKRGKVSSQPGQVSKAALKRMKLDLEEKKANDAVSAERMEEKRAQYQAASAKGIPQVVTDRMLKRITIFSGVPLLLGFSTGPLFYLGKTVAHFDLAPWQFFFASTATFGAALVGITYGVLSASWEPGREGSFWGVTEVKANIPILWQTILGKAGGNIETQWEDEWDDGR